MSKMEYIVIITFMQYMGLSWPILPLLFVKIPSNLQYKLHQISKLE